MTTITRRDIDRIRTAVEAAEGRTSAELVTVIARAAEPYLFIPTLFAAVVTMVLSGLALLLPFGAGLSAAELYTGQVLGFVAVAVLCRLPAIRFALVPRAIRNARASRLAHQMFLDLGLSDTPERNAVMFFVALGERYVEVMADRGLQERIGDSGAWDAVVAGFVAEVRDGRPADGFVQAIEKCSSLMAEHFPDRAGAANRFPDHLIEI